jgi:hypothetical protein
MLGEIFDNLHQTPFNEKEWPISLEKAGVLSDHMDIFKDEWARGYS